ncbi:hypothetical protein EBT31_20115, partial [bacterium]|nr:hypothetical protein [bacterium]
MILTKGGHFGDAPGPTLPEGGKRAITHGYIHSEAPPHSLIELKLQTGRTHQIRSHLRFLGFSIDRKKGEVFSGQIYMNQEATIVNFDKLKAFY